MIDPIADVSQQSVRAVVERERPDHRSMGSLKAGSFRQAFLALPPDRSITMMTQAAERLDRSSTISMRILSPTCIWPPSLARRAVDEMVGRSGWSWCLKTGKSIVFHRSPELSFTFGAIFLRLPIQGEFLEEVEDFHLL
jgi:hypothetical protein